MLDNEVRIGGVVKWVNIKPAKSWVKGTLKLQRPDFIVPVKVSSLQPGDRAVQQLQELKGKAIVIRGRLSSYVLRAKPPEYPKARTVYEVGMGKTQWLLARPDHAHTMNLAVCVCKVAETRVDSTGRLRALVNVRYTKPSNETGGRPQYGSYIARVACPPGIEQLNTDEEIFVAGVVDHDSLGILVNAHTLVRRP